METYIQINIFKLKTTIYGHPVIARHFPDNCQCRLIKYVGQVPNRRTVEPVQNASSISGIISLINVITTDIDRCLEIVMTMARLH